MKLILLSLIFVGLVSCSAQKTEETVEETDMGVELSDSDELVEDEAEDIVGDNTEEIISEDENADVAEAEIEDLNSATEENTEMADSSVENNQQEVVIDEVGGVQEYTVEKNDTLMMIAFKIYGDYSRWREIAEMNQDVLQNGQYAAVGTRLKYNAPSEKFNWSPEGNPYLIRTGDTLGSISSDTYGTMRYWRNIWDNNKPLIKDPNRIFAGFTIYTPVIEGREVATK